MVKENLEKNDLELQDVIEEKRFKKKDAEILSAIFFDLFFLGSIIYAAVRFNDATFQSKAITIITQNVPSLLIPLIPFLMRWIFKVDISLKLSIGINIFAFMGNFLGETCEFYYLIPFWDDILHFTSGFGIAFIAYCFFIGYTKDSLTHKNEVLVTVLSIFLSLGIIPLWEIVEFTSDSLFGTNMQKIMPENNTLFNGGFTNQNLNGTDEEIANFYKTPEGYSYALKDTMTDILMATGGTLLFLTFLLIVKRFKKDAFTNDVVFLKKQ